MQAIFKYGKSEVHHFFFVCSDAEEERKKEEMLKVAKKELEDWYKTHEEQIAKTKSANRYCSKKIIFSYSMLWFR